VRDAANAFRSGAFDDVIAIAARTRRSPVATMVATGLIAFASAPSQFTLREAIDIASRAFRNSQRTLTANLSLGVGTLRSFVSTAPFLGLGGTCFGILSAFRGIGMEKHAALAMITTYIAASLITTGAGLLVAVPAVWSYNYLRVRIDSLESEMSNMALEAITQLNAHPHWRSLREDFIEESRAIDSGMDPVAPAWEFRHKDGRTGACSSIAYKLPLGRQFSKLPAFALIAAPSLAMVIAGFMTFASFRSPMGLDVRVLQPALVTSAHFSVKPILIGLIEANGQTAVYVNSKKTPWENLDTTVRKELRIRPRSMVYVEADNNVPWSDAAKVIDAVETIPADVVLLTVAPEFNSSHMGRTGKSMK
jgi:biopolymer transport protein ExbB/TolQ/biopolymer transport protein ExbD